MRQDNVPAEAIWPKTNAIVIQYKLPDSIIPRIRDTVWTIRSGEWQHEFQRPEWGLNQEQALSLTKALLADLGAEVPKVTKHQIVPAAASNAITRPRCDT